MSYLKCHSKESVKNVPYLGKQRYKR